MKARTSDCRTITHQIPETDRLAEANHLIGLTTQPITIKERTLNSSPQHTPREKRAIKVPRSPVSMLCKAIASPQCTTTPWLSQRGHLLHIHIYSDPGIKTARIPNPLMSSHQTSPRQQEPAGIPPDTDPADRLVLRDYSLAHTLLSDHPR